MRTQDRLARIARVALMLGGITLLATNAPGIQKLGVVMLGVVISLAGISMGTQLERDRVAYQKRKGKH